MTDRLEFEIFQEPLPQKRHRHTKSGHVYDPSYKDKQNFCKEAMIYEPHQPIPGGIAIELIFFMLRPKIHFGTGKNINKLKESSPYEHITTPDTDNLVKFVLDSLGADGRFFNDDRQIISVKAKKLYANSRDTARTYVCLYSLDKEDILRWSLN